RISINSRRKLVGIQPIAICTVAIDEVASTAIIKKQQFTNDGATDVAVIVPLSEGLAAGDAASWSSRRQDRLLVVVELGLSHARSRRTGIDGALLPLRQYISKRVG